LLFIGCSSILLLIIFNDLESELIISESHILSRDETSEEDVDALSDRVGHSDDTVGTRLAIEHANEI